MAQVTIPLVQDPLTRRSLRKLYPELPAWAQRWAVATPDRLPPLPPGYHHAAWDSPQAAMAAMEDTCARSNPLTPGAGWTTRHELASPFSKGWVAHQIQDLSSLDSAVLEGMVTGWRAVDDVVDTLVVRHRGASLELTHRNSPRVDIDLSRGQKTIFHAYSMSNSRGLVRLFSGDEVVFADGTPMEITTHNHRPHAEQFDDPAEYSPHLIAACATALVTRWRALRSPTDQARIAGFWLGHPHPFLARAGMAVLTEQDTLLRPTPPRGRRGV
jgi:hypothetical protein